MSLEGVLVGSEEAVCNSLALASTVTLRITDNIFSLTGKYNHTNINCGLRAGAHEFLWHIRSSVLFIYIYYFKKLIYKYLKVHATVSRRCETSWFSLNLC